MSEREKQENNVGLPFYHPDKFFEVLPMSQEKYICVYFGIKA